MTFEKPSEHLRNSLMLKIGWKSFGNRWPCFEVVENLSAPLGTVRSCQEIFGNLRKLSGISSGILESRRKFSEVLQNLRKLFVTLRKFRFYGDEKSHILLKKVGTYIFSLFTSYCTMVLTKCYIQTHILQFVALKVILYF